MRESFVKNDPLIIIHKVRGVVVIQQVFPRSGSGRMGEEKQFGTVNGKPDSDGPNTKIHGWSKSDFTSNGNLVINFKVLF